MARRRGSRALTIVRRAPARVRTIVVRRARGFRHGKRKISIGQTIGLAIPSLLTYHAYRQYAAGMFDNAPATTIEAHLNCLLRGFLRTWTGYTWFGPSMGYKWAGLSQTFKDTYMPIIAGFGAHYMANRLGINRRLKRIPLVQV